MRGTYHAATSRRHTRTKPPMIIWFVPSMNSVKREDTWSICPICAIWTMSCSEPLELPCIGERPALPGMVCATLRSSGVPPFLLRGHLIFWMHPIRSNNRIEMNLNSLNNTLLFCPMAEDTSAMDHTTLAWACVQRTETDCLAAVRLCFF